MSRVILIHRWQGSPGADWYPWLKRELESRGHEVVIPSMPDPDTPNMHAWMGAIARVAGVVDENTFFVAHSIGCQAVLRYLAHVPNHGVAGGVVLVAPWTRLKEESFDSEADRVVARPWLELPLPWDAAKAQAKKFFCSFSDT
ncbi:MAG: alpha/beta hydrolase, partial [archaeon]